MPPPLLHPLSTVPFVLLCHGSFCVLAPPRTSTLGTKNNVPSFVFSVGNNEKYYVVIVYFFSQGINNAIHQKESLQKNQYNSRLTQIQSSYTADNTPLEKTSKAFLQTPERKHHSQTRKKITTHSGTEMKMTQNYYNDFAVIFDNMEQSRPVSLSISSDTVHLHEDNSIDDKEVEVSWPESLDSLDEELARIERHDMVEDSSESTPSPLPPKPEGQESGGNTCEDDHMHEHMKKRTVDEDCSLSEKNDFICIRANNLNEDSTKVSSIIVPESKKKEYLFDEGNNSKCEMNMNHDELQHYLEQVHPLEQLDVFVCSTTRNKHGTFDKEPELEMESLTNSAKERPQGKDLFGLSADPYATPEGCSSASLSSVDEDSDGSPSSLETEDGKKQKKPKYHAHGSQLPTIEDSSEDEELREEELLKEQERLLEQEQQLRKALGRKSRREKEEMRGQRRRQRSRASPSNLSPIEDASPTEELRQAAEMEELQRSSCSEYSPSAESEPEVFESYAEKLLKLQQEFHLLTTHPSGGKPVKKNGEYSQRQSRKSSGKKLKSAEEVYEEMMQKAQLSQSSSSKELSYSAVDGINDAPPLKNVKEDTDHDRQSASKNSQKYNGYSQANEQFTVLQNKNDDASFTNRNAVKGPEQEFQASQENHSPRHWLSNSSEESFAMPNVRTEEQTGLSSFGTSSHRPASVEPKFQTCQTKRLGEGTSTNSFDSKEQCISSDAQAVVTSGKGRASQTQEFSQRMSPQPRSASAVKEAQTTSEKHSHVAETVSRSLQHFGCQTDVQSNGKYTQGSSRLTKTPIVPNDETVTSSNNDQLRTYDPNCGLKLEDERTVVCCDVVYKLPFMRPKVTEQAFPTTQMSEQPSNKENKEVQVDMDVVGFSSLRPSYSDTNLVDSYHRQECQHGNRRNKARYTCDYMIEKRAALCQKPIRRYNSDLSIAKTDRECQCFHSPVNDDKYWHSTADTIQEINKLCAELKELQQQWVAYNHQREHEQASQLQTRVTTLLPPNVAQQGSSKSFKGNVQQLPSSSFSEIDTCLLKDKSALNQPCPFPESRISTSATIICTTTTCVLSSIPITTQPISLLVPGFRQSPNQDCIRFSIPNTSANTFTMSSYPRSQNLPHQPSLGLVRSIGPQSIFSSSLGAVPFSRGAAPLQFGREGAVQGFISPLQQYQGGPFVYGKPALTRCIQSTKPENLPCAIPMQHAFSGITSINGETGLGIPTKTQLLQQQLNIINSMLQRNASFSPWPLMSQNQRPDVSGRDKTINVPIHPLTALSSSLPPSNAANALNRVDVASYGNLHVRNELVQSNAYENNGSKQDKLSDVKKEADSNAPKDLTKESEEMAKARASSNSFGTQNDVYKQHQQQIVLEYRRVQEELDRERREMQRQLEQEKQVVQSELQHLWGMKQQIWQQQQEVRQAELAQQLELVAQQRKQLVNMQQLQQQLQQQIEEQNMKKIPLLRESCDYIHSSTGYTHARTDEKVGLYPHPSCPVHKPASQIAVDVTQQVTHQPIASPTVELSAKESKGRRAMRRKSFAITARTSTEEDDEASQDDEYVTLPRRRLRANSGVQTDDEERTQSHGSRRRLAHRKVDCSVQTDDEDNEDKYEYGDGTTTKPKLGYLERSKMPIQYEVRAANIGTPTQIVTDCFVQTKTRETKDFASVKSAPRPPTDTILQTATPPQNVEGFIFPGHRVCEPQLSFGPQSIQSQITPEQYFLALSLQGNAVNYLPRFDGRMNSQAQHQLRASSTMLPTATATTHPAMSLAMEREHLLREIDKELQLVEKASSKLQRQQPHLHTAHKDSHNHTGGVSVQMVNPEQVCTDNGQRLIHFQGCDQ
uniref:Uncharacterized protein n=1 Tax=Eptatretus burgeri TaxID=7764 RepID=A0A8C4QAZ3_EPTBU